MDHEPEFVDEVASKQRTDESAAAEDRDVFSRLPLEPGDLPCYIAFDQGRVVPPEGLFQVVETTYLGTLLM